MLARTNSSVAITGALSLNFSIAKLRYSCQEGLPEPPRTTKKRQQASAHDSDAKPVPPPRNGITARSLQDEQKRQAEPQESRTKPAKRNPIPQQLDAMHKNTNKSRGSKAMPNFDLQLTTLKRSRSPTLSEPTSTDDCGDELSLISEVWGQDNATSAIDPVAVEGCEVPPPKRSRTDVAVRSLGPPLSRKKVYHISSVSPH